MLRSAVSRPRKRRLSGYVAWSEIVVRVAGLQGRANPRTHAGRYARATWWTRSSWWMMRAATPPPVGQKPGLAGVRPREESWLRRQPKDLLPRSPEGRGRYRRDAASRLSVRPAAGDGHGRHDRLEGVRRGDRLPHSRQLGSQGRDAAVQVRGESRLDVLSERVDGRQAVRVSHGLSGVLPRRVRNLAAVGKLR